MHYLFHHEVVGNCSPGHFLPFLVAQHTLAIVKILTTLLREISAVVKNGTIQSYTFQLRLKSR